MNNPLVSIAICTYNGEKHLIEQLESIVNQTYKNLQIIAVDDLSTDSTIEILKSYQNKYPFFTYYQNSGNLGYVKNFETAISKCTGDYIALSDQDDIWNLDKIEKQIKGIGSHGLIYHDSSFIDENGNLLSRKLSDVYTPYHGNKPHPFLFFNCVAGHSILFNKRLVKDILPFNKEYFHDRWIANIASERGGIKLIPESLVQYRQHHLSITDALGMKVEENQQDLFFSKTAITWIKICSEKSVKNQTYFNKILACFNDQGMIINKFKLFFLLLSHVFLIFYTVKKSKFSKLNYLRKICFSPKHSIKPSSD
ncbi:glycosyltransferase family 2 protein [Pedobacter punctiformis]|uniref:Glycosyltransferase family 2 protein n=1 Tax=Pedobacter punctiformis TaxID=3004097 RepID=A0ABT4L6D9_9SPHI|nr:glycosyltransferase family 2 protein [Pedobacter sp. HCMS5-2]MCZ4243492.1 glycosyltransferase family 2 protein [Pedobacter sp. HCMS5-2]